MKKLLVVLLCVAMLAGCSSGIPRADYEAVVAERDALKAQIVDLQTDLVTPEVRTPEVSDTPEKTAKPNDQSIPTMNPIPVGEFDESTVISQLDVVEHHYMASGRWPRAVLVIKNNSEFDIDISVELTAHDGDGKIIAAQSASEVAFERGCEIALMFGFDEEYDALKYELSVDETDYETIVSDLSYETNPAEHKEIVSITNNGAAPASFVEGTVLFFSGGNLAGYDRTYFTDDDSELKPGKTISEEMDCYEEYDSFQLYLTGRR